MAYKTADELSAAIEDYFKTADAGKSTTELTKRGELKTYDKPMPYTFEDLALHLDISTETIRNYAKTDKFFGLISRARARIKASWLRAGLDRGYDSRMVALCLAAQDPDYRISQKTDLTISTVEDRLRQIQANKQKAIENKGLPAITQG